MCWVFKIEIKPSLNFLFYYKFCLLLKLDSGYYISCWCCWCIYCLCQLGAFSCWHRFTSDILCLSSDAICWYMYMPIPFLICCTIHSAICLRPHLCWLVEIQKLILKTKIWVILCFDVCFFSRLILFHHVFVSMIFIATNCSYRNKVEY